MKDITIVAIDFLYHDLTRYAIEHSLKHIDPKEVVVISDREIMPGVTTIIQDPVANMTEYNTIMLKGVTEHVNTAHSLYVQWDGIANDRTQWTDEFLDYDYIGAIWPWEPKNKNVGNGGFSLRSKRLLDACMDEHIQLNKSRNMIAEDAVIGIDHRDFLENTHGIKFAPSELATQFSFELGVHRPSFGFHGLWNIFNLMGEEDQDYYYTRIDYKGWNHYKWHHTLAALIRTGRMDIYEFMLNRLIENNPEFLNVISDWLERDSRIPRRELIID
jgi:hypothetical protein